LLLLPIHLPSHWALAAVTIDPPEISFDESPGSASIRYLRRIRRVLLREAVRVGNGNLKQMGVWTLRGGSAGASPQQLNNDDCGVMVATAAEFLAQGRPMHFSQGDMRNARMSGGRRMVAMAVGSAGP